VNNFKKILLVMCIFSTIALVAIGYLIYNQLDNILDLRNSNNQDIEIEVTIPRTAEEVTLIQGLPPSDGYKLRGNSTLYQIQLFETLIHAHNNYNETRSNNALLEYASAISRNFVADFFTLSNKNSRTDIGGLQFFSDEVIDDFKVAAEDEFYLYMNQYINIFGSESLPTVATTTIIYASFTTIELDNDEQVVEEENTTYGTFWSAPAPQQATAIIVDVEWTYEFTTLREIHEFQTSVRILLKVGDDDRVTIFMISEIPELNELELETQPW